MKKLQFPVSVGDASEGDELLVRVLDDKDTVLYEKTLSCGSLYEGELVSLAPGIPLQKDGVYKVSFTLTEENGDSTFRLLGCSDRSAYDGAVLDGEVQDYHLDMKVFQ